MSGSDSLSRLSGSEFSKVILKLTNDSVSEEGWFGPRKVTIGDGEPLGFNDLIQEVGKHQHEMTLEQVKECLKKIKNLEGKTRPWHQFIFNRSLSSSRESSIDKMIFLKGEAVRKELNVLKPQINEIKNKIKEKEEKQTEIFKARIELSGKIGKIRNSSAPDNAEIVRLTKELDKLGEDLKLISDEIVKLRGKLKTLKNQKKAV